MNQPPRRIRRLTPADMPQVAEDPLQGWDVQEVPDEPDEPQHLTVTVDSRRAVEQYSKTRKLYEATGKQVDTYKRQIMDMLDTDGDEDGEGHKYFRFDDDPVPGFDNKGALVAVKREKRVGSTIDQDAAMALAEKYKVEGAIETIQVLNEDALLAANFSGVIPDDELQAIYSEKITYAFVPIKEKR